MGFLITLVYGGYLATSGNITVGSYSLLIFLTPRLLWPLTESANITIAYQKTMVAAIRAFSLFDKNIMDDNRNVQIIENPKGAIFLTNVFVGYDDNCKILDNISFQAKAGQTIAFVGNTGAGKTTIIKLLLGGIHKVLAIAAAIMALSLFSHDAKISYIINNFVALT